MLAGALLRGGELAGAGRNGAPGLGLACGLAGESLRGARDPLVASARGDGDRTWLRDGDGGWIQGKARGSLAKRQGRTGIYAYGPLDLDLVAQRGLDLDLI